jgi:zinc transport system permease protein
MLEHEFMRRALFVGMILSVIIPCIGTVVVLKHLSMLGDALSHSSLAGIAAGLAWGFNPVAGAILCSVLAALSIEVIRKKVPKYEELSIAVVLSTGIGLAAILSGYTSAGNFNSFLFGSIVAVTASEMLQVAAVGGVVLVSFILLYRELLFIAFDENAARLAGVPVKRVNLVFTLLTAVTLSLAARTVGALIVSSMLVIPVVCAMQLARSYKQTVWYAVGLAELFTLAGLTLSFYYDLKPGGAIVLTGVAFLLLLLLLGGLFTGKRRR